jgi:hypothetical protein
MTEEECLACEDPEELLKNLPGDPSQRRFLLLGVACCRMSSEAMSIKQCVRAINAAEQFADDPKASIDVKNARRAIQKLRDLHWGKEDERQIYPVTGVCHGLTSSKQFVIEDAAFRALDLWPQMESEQRYLIHCIFGNPFRPVSFLPEWRTSTVLALAQGIYSDRAFDRSPYLLMLSAMQGVISRRY